MENPTLDMGRPLALRLLGRSTMIAAMLAGGLLCAGISQAHAQDAVAAPSPEASSSPDAAAMSAERARELIAAVGGPASPAHLIAFAPKTSDVEVRDDDVEDAGPDPSAALNAAQLNGAELRAAPAPASSADVPPPPSELIDDR